ncbi:universal stress protein [Streptomyces sp. NPDC046197]|uniref:universal stress protein n=1 Tax=Streptomyces sp. NPDC046197 TaxID=3154337 RepID=UPI0033C46147
MARSLHRRARQSPVCGPDVVADPFAVAPVTDDAVAGKGIRQYLPAAWLRPWRRKFPEVPIEVDVVLGRRGHQLLQTCARSGLLIVGRRAGSGRGLGEVACPLVHHCCCPVAVVPDG